jgi:hypothetical protein
MEEELISEYDLAKYLEDVQDLPESISPEKKEVRNKMFFPAKNERSNSLEMRMNDQAQNIPEMYPVMYPQQPQQENAKYNYDGGFMIQNISDYQYKPKE